MNKRVKVFIVIMFVMCTCLILVLNIFIKSGNLPIDDWNPLIDLKGLNASIYGYDGEYEQQKFIEDFEQQYMSDERAKGTIFDFYFSDENVSIKTNDGNKIRQFTYDLVDRNVL